MKNERASFRLTRGSSSRSTVSSICCCCCCCCCCCLFCLFRFDCLRERFSNEKREDKRRISVNLHGIRFYTENGTTIANRQHASQRSSPHRNTRIVLVLGMTKKAAAVYGMFCNLTEPDLAPRHRLVGASTAITAVEFLTCVNEDRVVGTVPEQSSAAITSTLQLSICVCTVPMNWRCSYHWND